MPKPRRQIRRRTVVIGILTFLIVATASFTIAAFLRLRGQVLVAHEGSTSGVLNYKEADTVDMSQFVQAGDGRFNLALVGVGGINDSGTAHSGTYLTDSIQVISLDPVNHTIGITGIPRDLYSPTYRSKINAVYTYAEQTKKGSGPLAVREELGKILGIKISNFALIDFTGFKDAVDSVDGVDVTVPANLSVSDPYFPCDDERNYCPFYMSAGLHHMDGKTALSFSRSRETSSDFARVARQQLVISALKSKALSLGTLSNPAKVSSLIQVLGSHFKTDMDLTQLSTFLSLYKDIPTTSTTSNVLDNTEKEGLLTDTSDPVIGYIEYPIKGYSDYSDIQSWFQLNNPDPFIKKEAAKITVSGTGKATAKQLQDFVTVLKNYGYNASLSTTPYVGKAVTATTLYETSPGSKPFSHNYLDTQFGVTAQSGSPLASGSDFEILYVPQAKR
jgi:LCP family protein required for cell wall assembly